MKVKEKIYNLLRWSEKYTQTDMVYLAKGGFWLTLSNLVSAVSGFLLAIAFANLLPKETYGTYRYVLSLASILAIPTLSGMNTAVVRAVARGYEGSFIPALKARLKWGIFSTIAALCLSGYYLLQGNTTLTFYFLIAAASLPLMYSFTIYEAFWGGKKRFDIQTKYRITIQILGVSALIITLFLTKNLFLILLAYFFSYTLSRFIFLQLTIKKSHLNQKQDPQTISYGKYLSLMNVIGLIATHLDKILLWHFLGAVPLAVYSFAISPPKHIGSLFKNIYPLALPKFSQRSVKELKATLLKKVVKLFLIITPVVVGYIILAPYIYKLLFPAYLESVPYSQLFAVTFILAPQILLGTAFGAQMRKKEIYIIKFTSPLIRIILLLILLPLYGIWGAILAVIFAQMSNFALLLFLFKKMQ